MSQPIAASPNLLQQKISNPIQKRPSHFSHGLLSTNNQITPSGAELLGLSLEIMPVCNYLSKKDLLNLRLANHFTKDKVNDHFRLYNKQFYLNWQLRIAVESDDLAAVNYWIAQGANPNHLGSEEQNLLCEAKTVPIMEVLIKNGAEVDLDDFQGQTPLFWVKDADLALCLIKYNADVNAVDYLGNTPLHCCLSLSIAQTLLNHQADINAVCYIDRTPLYWVETLEQAKLFISLGLNVNHIDVIKNTPLHCCTKPAIANYLISQGADLHACNSMGQNALFTVAFSRVAQFFIDKGLNINAQDNLGNTPLHIHAAYNKFNIVSILIANHANPLLINAEGKTAAMQCSNPSMKDYLTQAETRWQNAHNNKSEKTANLTINS